MGFLYDRWLKPNGAAVAAPTSFFETHLVSGGLTERRVALIASANYL